MNRLTLLFLFTIFSFTDTFAQNIYDLIEQNKYDEIKKYDGSLNIYNPEGTTPLMYAIYKSNLKTVKLLIKKGADPKMKSWLSYYDKKRKSLRYLYGNNFVLAAGENKLDILKYFLKKKYFTIDEKEYNFYERNIQNGWNAIQWAAVRENIEIMQFLVKKGADINSTAETDNNKTALLLSLDMSKIKSAIFLINNNADINYRVGGGISAMDFAFELKNKEIIKLIYSNNFLFKENEKEEFEDKLQDLFGIHSFDEL